MLLPWQRDVTLFLSIRLIQGRAGGGIDCVQRSPPPSEKTQASGESLWHGLRIKAGLTYHKSRISKFLSVFRITMISTLKYLYCNLFFRKSVWWKNSKVAKGKEKLQTANPDLHHFHLVFSWCQKSFHLTEVLKLKTVHAKRRSHRNEITNIGSP